MHLQRRRSFLTGCILALAAATWSVCALGQAAPSAYRDSDALWVGAEYANVNPSFPYQSNQRMYGMGGFVDFNLNEHFGLEGNIQFYRFDGFHQETESTYLAGPRYRFRRIGKFQPYAQGLFGIGKIHYPFDIGDATYFDIAPNGGVNYRVSSRWLLRAEYEYQFWLNSPGYSNQPDHPFRPNGFHAGLAYRLFR